MGDFLQAILQPPTTQFRALSAIEQGTCLRGAAGLAEDSVVGLAEDSAAGEAEGGGGKAYLPRQATLL